MNNTNYTIPENKRIARETFFAQVRLSYTIFVSIILLIVAPKLQTPLWAIIIFVISALLYGIWRYHKPTGIPEGRRVIPVICLLDFVFIGVLVYLTGGMKSFFHVAYAFPIYAAALHFGLWGGISSFVPAIIITAAMYILDAPAHSLSKNIHIITGLGSLAFATWMVITLSEKEWELRRSIYLSSVTDSLTGLYNTAYLKIRVQEEISRSLREGTPFTIAFFDLDNFKQVNDRYGHLAGDKVIKEVAKRLHQNIRSSEVLARYGGDEFVFLMPGADKLQAEKVVERLQRAVNSLPFHVQDIRIGISGGIAGFPADGENFEQLLSKADQRMYEKKR